MIELTKGQLDELATGRVVVAVPCDPQPLFEPMDGYYYVDGRPLFKWDVAPSLRRRYPHDKIPTPAGDAIVRDVDVRLNEVWEWIITLELEGKDKA